MSDNEAVLRLIERVPDDASLEEIMYTLYFRKRVDRGLRELDEGKTVGHEEVRRSLPEWLRAARPGAGRSDNWWLGDREDVGAYCNTPLRPYPQ